MNEIDTIIPELWRQQYDEDRKRVSFFDKYIPRFFVSDWLKLKWDIKKEKGKIIKFKIT